MTAVPSTTLESIHKAAKAEFLAKGFKSASLRNIVKSVGMTTGAFYGYYNSKEELFSALVDEQYMTFMNKYGRHRNLLKDFLLSTSMIIWETFPVNAWIGWWIMSIIISMHSSCLYAVQREPNTST